MSTNPETSIVIRTFNEERHLPVLLEGIGKQDYRDFEIVVVDSGSVDRTREIAARQCQKLLRIDSRDFTFGYSLNAGIQATAGRFVVISSAHMLPLDGNWLGTLISPLRDERAAMVYGRQLGAPTSKFSEGQDLARTFGSQRKRMRPPYFFANNANSALQRHLWEEYPFDESLPGLEDIAWAKHWMEKGYWVLYEPGAAMYHLHEESWPQLRRRYYREAVAARQIGIKSSRDVTLEVLRQGKYLLADLLEATHRKAFWTKSNEIVLFRVNKAIGSAKGLLDGTLVSTPTAREAFFFDRTCKGVIIHGPGHSSFEAISIPQVKPGDVLIKVAYAGVCATDLEVFHGTLPYYKSGLAKYPIVPGHEFSGHIAKVGTNVQNLREGDAVVVECIQGCGSCSECLGGNGIACSQRKEVGVFGQNGAYAEYIAVPGRFVHQLPSGIDSKAACFCEPLAVVLKGLKRLEKIWKGVGRAEIAVVGGGPIGHLCAQVLSLRGNQVTVFDKNPQRRASFEKTSVATTDDLGKLSDFKVFVEATGSAEALDALLRRSPSGSFLLLLGFPYGKRDFDFAEVVSQDKAIIGSVGSGPEEFEEALQMLPQLPLEQFTNFVLPLKKFREGWEICEEGKRLKVLLQVNGGLK